MTWHTTFAFLEYIESESMALNVSIGGTTFNLVISSDAIDASLVSLKFLPDPNDKKRKLFKILIMSKKTGML